MNYYQLYIYKSHAVSLNWFQMKYKKGKNDVSSSLYSTLPETMDTLHAKEASELQSEVRATHTHRHALVRTSIHPLFLRYCYRWITVCALVWIQLKYKAGLKKSLSSSLFHQLPETLETAHAKDVSELLSEVTAGRRGSELFRESLCSQIVETLLVFSCPGEVQRGR